MQKRIVLLLVAAVSAAGCAKKNTVSVEPAALCSMPDECTFSATCSAQTIETSTTFDVAGAVRMWLAVEMRNQLTNNADPTTGRGNSHDAHFESYSITYEGSGGLLAPTGEIPAASGPTQQSIPAGGTAVIGFDAILQSAANDLAASSAVPSYPDYVQVVAHVTFKGRYDDNSSWEAPFSVPIRICQNCVANTCAFGEAAGAACPTRFQEPHGAVTCTKVPTCYSSGTLCGNRLLNGDQKVLYQCSAWGMEGIPLELCADGCVVATPNPDFCKPPPICQAVGVFCGGPNVLNGDGATLYNCGTIGAPPTGTTVCTNGCDPGPPAACITGP